MEGRGRKGVKAKAKRGKEAEAKRGKERRSEAKRQNIMTTTNQQTNQEGQSEEIREMRDVGPQRPQTHHELTEQCRRDIPAETRDNCLPVSSSRPNKEKDMLPDSHPLLSAYSLTQSNPQLVKLVSLPASSLALCSSYYLIIDELQLRRREVRLAVSTISSTLCTST
jgi:hypothetical protein